MFSLLIPERSGSDFSEVLKAPNNKMEDTNMICVLIGYGLYFISWILEYKCNYKKVNYFIIN
jgi:hypothetical protein